MHINITLFPYFSVQLLLHITRKKISQSETRQIRLGLGHSVLIYSQHNSCLECSMSNQIILQRSAALFLVSLMYRSDQPKRYSNATLSKQAKTGVLY